MRELSQLRVCFVAGTLGQGGAERQLYYILGALRASGASAEVLSLTRGEFWEEKIRALGIPVTWVGQRPSRALRLARIIGALRTRRPDIIQSQHGYANLYAWAAARVLGARDVGAVRGNANAELRDNGRLLGGLSLRAPRTVVANSDAAVTGAIALGVPAHRLQMLPNAVDETEFRPAATTRQGPVTLLAIGRLTPVKRFDRLIRVCAGLIGQCAAPFRALIVGDGPERERLEQQAADAGLLSGIVEFRGAASSTGALYREADALVLTSDSEGTPNVILEAMASALPVVSTNVGGVPEVVAQGLTGLLADPADEPGLRSALQQVVDDPELRATLGRRAREHVLAHHSLQHLPQRLSHLYGAVCAQ